MIAHLANRGAVTKTFVLLYQENVETENVHQMLIVLMKTPTKDPTAALNGDIVGQGLNTVMK